MVWLKDNFIKEAKTLSGVICIASATYIHGLSNFPPSPLIRFSTITLEQNPRRYKVINPDRTLPLTEDLELIANRLYVTNKERTICDMILYESNDEFIYDSIETYLDLHGTTDTLRQYAKKSIREDRSFFFYQKRKHDKSELKKNN